MTQDSQAIAAEYRGYAEAFQDQSVVEAYRHRPPYPDSTFDILTQLLPAHFTAILDVGCGRGELARHLVERVERVDAVDVSRCMIEQGKQLPHGNHPRLRWVQGRIEEVQLQPPYALVTAGASLHWMDWNRVMARFAELLLDGAYLAVVGSATIPGPWTLLGEMLSHYRTDRYISQPPDVQEQHTVWSIKWGKQLSHQTFTSQQALCLQPFPKLYKVKLRERVKYRRVDMYLCYNAFVVRNGWLALSTFGINRGLRMEA